MTAVIGFIAQSCQLCNATTRKHGEKDGKVIEMMIPAGGPEPQSTHGQCPRTVGSDPKWSSAPPGPLPDS